MNPGSPKSPREEFEARLTALLLGELSAEEAAALREVIKRDTALAGLHDRLKRTIELVRHTASTTAAQPSEEPSPLRLSDERRQKLLAQFKTVRLMEFAASRGRETSWLVPIAVAASLVLLLAVGLLPALSKAKSKAKALTPLAGLQMRFGEAEADVKDASFTDGDHRVHGVSQATKGAGVDLAPQKQPAPEVAGKQVQVYLPPTDADAAPPSESLRRGEKPEAAPGPTATFANRLGALAAEPPYGGRGAGVGTHQQRLEGEKEGTRGAFKARIGAVPSSRPQAQSVASPAQPPAAVPAPGGLVSESAPGPTTVTVDDVPQNRAAGELAGGRAVVNGPAPAEGVPVVGDLPALGSFFQREAGHGRAIGGVVATPESLVRSPRLDAGTTADAFRLRSGEDNLSALGTGVARSEARDAIGQDWYFSDDKAKAGDISFGFRSPAQPAAKEEASEGQERGGKSKDAAQDQEVVGYRILAPQDQSQLGQLAEERRKADIVLPPAETVGVLESDLAKTEELARSRITATRATRPASREGVGQVKGVELAQDRRLLHEMGKAEDAGADLPLRKPATNAPIPQPEIQTTDNAFSTFSLNVSDVAFKLAAASLEKGQMPDAASVRAEEFINAFDYRDPEAPPGVPVAFAWERARYPFAHNRDLLRFSLKTAAAGRQAGRPLSLVLLLDNSGSMERADRVQIIREALRVLAGQLQPQDKLSVITFARTPRLWVDGLVGGKSGEVLDQIAGLTPQGGTNLEEAMNLAYATALRHYLAGGINRVVLLTDGAANLGNVEPESLKQKVELHRQQGVAFDCFGIGWEGFNDDLLEVLSRNGDGRYGFINSPDEAATEFAGQLAGALKVAASDVKVQVEFNQQRVTAYRQIGYAKHQLTKEQFRDNTVDAAEIAAQEAGNALYVVEVNPRGEGPLAIVRVRYKVPGTAEYHEHEWIVPFTGFALPLAQSSPALRLAATASAFAEWLVVSPFAAEVSPDALLGYLRGVPEVYGADERPKKLEWMIRQAKSLTGN